MQGEHEYPYPYLCNVSCRELIAFNIRIWIPCRVRARAVQPQRMQIFQYAGADMTVQASTDGARCSNSAVQSIQQASRVNAGASSIRIRVSATATVDALYFRPLQVAEVKPMMYTVIRIAQRQHTRWDGKVEHHRGALIGFPRLSQWRTPPVRPRARKINENSTFSHPPLIQGIASSPGCPRIESPESSASRVMVLFKKCTPPLKMSWPPPAWAVARPARIRARPCRSVLTGAASVPAEESSPLT